MSRSERRSRDGEAARRGAPRGAAVVAVLERRGRFVTAEPLFPPPRSQDGPARARRGGQLVVRATRSGPGARARPGDLVLVRVPPRGYGASVERVLGRPDVARDVIEALMIDRGLRREFPPEVEREATAAGQRIERSDGERRDLRGLATFTIDPAGARDFDDAVSAEALDSGVTRVWVHIADVAAHVPEGSLVDREARRRATSVYVPGAVEPMLPHALSSDACSLLPDADRAAVTVELELRGAEVLRAAFYRSLIRSDARLDYERVDRVFAGAEQAAVPWAEPLARARAVAAALQEQRERRGALAVDSEEPEFVFDERGNVTDVRGRRQTESHRLIEHLMIAANEAVARLLEQRGVPCLYRVHENPDPQRIEQLVAQLASLDVPTPPVPENMSPSRAAELVGEISRLVDADARRSGRGRAALSSLVLRSLKQAYYSPQNIGHAGLRSPSYCHFTSPIRRYPDLVCHRALLSAVGGGESAPRAEELGELGAWTSERERAAALTERDADDVARCFLLQRVVREAGPDAVYDGEITGLIPAGVFAAFARGARRDGDAAPVERPFEGMLPVRLLGAGTPADATAGGAGRGAGTRGGGRRGGAEQPRDWWQLNEQGTILRGERSGATLRLGDRLDVRVARVDTVRGRVDLLPAG